MQPVEVKPDATHLNLDLAGHSFVNILNKDGQRVATMRGNNPQMSFSLPPGEYSVETDGKATAVTVAAPPVLAPAAPLMAGVPFVRRVTLTHDGENLHPVDRAVLLPADGTSHVTCTLQKMDHTGKALAQPEDRDTIYVRTTGGFLQDEGGKPLDYKIALVDGTARFRLVSESVRKVVTVQVLTGQPDLIADQLTVEFI